MVKFIKKTRISSHKVTFFGAHACICGLCVCSLGVPVIYLDNLSIPYQEGVWKSLRCLV